MKETFNEDLKVGVDCEIMILNLIKLKYPKSHKVYGYFKDYDIYIPEINKSVEVKGDYKSHETGNLVVEIEFNGVESALSTTKADYWVFVTQNLFYWITPKNIRKCINDYDYTPRSFVGRGDTVSKMAYLIKIEHLKEYTL